MTISVQDAIAYANAYSCDAFETPDGLLIKREDWYFNRARVAKDDEWYESLITLPVVNGCVNKRQLRKILTA